MRSHIDSTPVADHFSLSCWYINSDSGMFSVLLTLRRSLTEPLEPGLESISCPLILDTSFFIIQAAELLWLCLSCHSSISVFFHFVNLDDKYSQIAPHLAVESVLVSGCLFSHQRWHSDSHKYSQFCTKGGARDPFFFFGECSLYTPNWYPRLGDWRTTWNVPGVYVNRRSEPVHHGDKRPFTLTFTPLIN